jgi:hypothetical protein
MDTEAIIKQLDSFQVKLFVRNGGEVLPADPVTLSNNLLLIRGLLIQLVEKVYDAELDYRKAKAARFDRFLKEGIKKSPAMDQLEMEDDLIDKKLSTERVRNYMKYVDGLCTSIQSVLKVQAGSEKNQY